MSDPRHILARAGRAASWLEGVVAADSYVDPRPMTVTRLSAPIRAAPEAGAEQVDQLLFGEGFDVLEAEAGWALGQARRDGYVGWTETAALTDGAPTPTHRVSALRAFAFAEPDIKAPAVGPLPMNALVQVDGEAERFVCAAGLGWIRVEQLSLIGLYAHDPASVALQHLGAPYLWGGRDGLGLDCSGLVQQAFFACGRACPRDSDLQAGIGRTIEAGQGLSGLQRGDLVFWDGHVGMMLDERRLIHANAYHMCVEVEPLATAVVRIRDAGLGEPVAFRRP